MMARSAMSASWPLILAAATACANRGELLGVIPDPGDGGAPDAPPLEPPRFGPGVLVAPISDPGAIDEDPTLTADLVELYFMSSRAGTRDIWISRRGSAQDPWGPPALVPELSSPASDWAAAVSLDGLRIWFTSDRDGGRGQIWRATRATRGEPFGALQSVPELDGGSVDFAPALDATETTLFFASDRPGGAGFDIYSSRRPAPTGAWAAPARVGGIWSDADEYDPFVAQGGLVVFFTSMRSGDGDIYWSARRSTDQPFQPPALLESLASAAYDSDSTLSADLTYMMFSSTRSGNAEIYETRLLP